MQQNPPQLKKHATKKYAKLLQSIPNVIPNAIDICIIPINLHVVIIILFFLPIKILPPKLKKYIY